MRIFALVLGGLSGLVSLALWVAALVIALRSWRETRPLLFRGAIYAAIVMALGAPTAILVTLHLDIRAFVPNLPPVSASVVRIVVATVQVGVAVVALVHGMFEVPAAVIVARERRPFPLLLGQQGRFAGWIVGAGCGAVLAVLSVVVFHVLKIDAGSDLKNVLKALPAVDWGAPVVTFGVLLPAVSAAALTEEVTFRGILQPLLGDQPNASRFRANAALVATSLLWACAHSLNTSSPLVKLGQIFAIGLLFGGIARRYSVEASAVAHLTLNAVAVLAGFFVR